MLLQLVDKQHFAPVAGQVHLAGDPVQQQDVDHRVQVGAALQLLVLDDDEVVGKIDVVLALEKALVLPALGVGVEHDGQILDALVAHHAQFFDGSALEGVAQAGDA